MNGRDPTVVGRPLSGEPLRMPLHTFYFQKLESLGHIFVINSVSHLHSTLHARLHKTHNTVEYIMTVQDIGTSRKYMCNFLLVFSVNFGS